ncbi:MAG: 1-acyl-sn-glycerol-3-phosphate acyltransferase, partial [Parachlamydia sp.]|nr:1-acyl-sn-glycerol-3-phosphate acyltransferase [Parachlamydia sp.]
MRFLSQFSNFLTNSSFVLYHSLILPLRYRVNVVGVKRVGTHLSDEKGGVLFLSNHPSHLDPSMVGYALWQNQIRLYIWTVDYVFKHIFTRFAARSSDSVKLLKVPDVFEGRSASHADKSQRLIRKTVEKLRKGDNVLFFPGGKQKHAAYEEVSGKSAVQRILKLYPNVNIVMVTVKGMWGSRFSRAVKKSERSNLKANSILRFLWNILKIVLLNGLFFIPRRNIQIEFTPVGSDF